MYDHTHITQVKRRSCAAPYLDSNDGVPDIYSVKSYTEVMEMTSSLAEAESTKKRICAWVYLEVVSQIGGAGQSACCLSAPSGSVSHMTHTGEGGFCYSGLDSLGGGKPKHRNRERESQTKL